MSWGMVAAAGAGIVGASMQADAAGDASAAQSAATREANALQKQQYDLTRSDLAPFRQYGVGAVNELSKRLGIGGQAGAAPAMTYDQARAQLLPQFTTQAQDDGIDYNDPLVRATLAAQGRSAPVAGPAVDEQGLSNAVAQLLASQPAQQPAQPQPEVGSLLKPFTGADVATDPGYQFGMQQGQTALDRKAQAGGSYYSGAALKAASRYGQDYAGTKFGEAFNRDAATKGQVYNFLSGGASLGQNAAAMTGNAGTNMANSVGANTTALGNAQGAASIATGNAYNNALMNGVNGYNQNTLVDKILGGNKGWGVAYPNTTVNPSRPYGYELDW